MIFSSQGARKEFERSIAQAFGVSARGEKRRTPFNPREEDTSMTDKRQGMSTSEAGQKGGAATSRSHGKEFYQEIGHKGGQASGGNFANDPQRAAEAGRKGGQQSGGNFANDPEEPPRRAARAASRAAGTSPTIGKRPPRQDARVASTATAADARPDRAEPLKRTAHPQRDAPFSHRPKRAGPGLRKVPFEQAAGCPCRRGKRALPTTFAHQTLRWKKSSASWKLGRSGTFQSGWAVK